MKQTAVTVNEQKSNATLAFEGPAASQVLLDQYLLNYDYLPSTSYLNRREPRMASPKKLSQQARTALNRRHFFYAIFSLYKTPTIVVSLLSGSLNIETPQFYFVTQLVIYKTIARASMKLPHLLLLNGEKSDAYNYCKRNIQKREGIAY
jgi:hypothetical protein